jgi:hypothetical protein
VNTPLPAGMAAYLARGGPIDGETVAIRKGETELRWTVPDYDLETLLKASLRIQQGELVTVPTKTAIYELVRHAVDDNVVPLERKTLEFRGWG